jgi:hypothetical protein
MRSLIVSSGLFPRCNLRATRRRIHVCDNLRMGNKQAIRWIYDLRYRHGIVGRCYHVTKHWQDFEETS